MECCWNWHLSQLKIHFIWIHSVSIILKCLDSLMQTLFDNNDILTLRFVDYLYLKCILGVVSFRYEQKCVFQVFAGFGTICLIRNQIRGLLHIHYRYVFQHCDCIFYVFFFNRSKQLKFHWLFYRLVQPLIMSSRRILHMKALFIISMSLSCQFIFESFRYNVILDNVYLRTQHINHFNEKFMIQN